MCECRLGVGAKNNKQHFITVEEIFYFYSFRCRGCVPEGGQSFICAVDETKTGELFHPPKRSTYKFLMIVVHFDDCVLGLATSVSSLAAMRSNNV